jgi:hypothetical protein
MKTIFPRAAAAGFVAVAILGIATFSNRVPAAIAAGAAVSEGQRVAIVDIRIRTDKYLVPAHVCPDADAEKYEDCVPRSQVGEYATFELPAAE